MDPAQPTTTAVAVKHGRIVGVGADEEIQPFIGRTTRTLDAQGALLLPGFNDAHVHFLMGGFHLGEVALRDCASPVEFADRLGRHAATQPAGSWITGGGWDHERWAGAPLPSRGMIDPFTADHPVFVSRLDCHMALANGIALALAGITRATPDPAGGLIVRDARTGEPTGLLKDAAMKLVSRVVPAPSHAAKRAAARAASRHAAMLGVTSVQDMSTDDDLGVYQELDAAGSLDTRLAAHIPLRQWDRLAALGVRAGFGSARLRIGAVKAFADGSLGSGTAWFFEDYTDEPGNRGLATDEMQPPGALLERALAVDAAGLQLAIHAIGDRANAEILDLFEAVIRRNGTRDRRARIEHAQHLRPADLARFGRLGVIASMQPYHCADDGRWAERRLGADRCRSAYAFRSLTDRGAILAFGSDWTVAPLDPMTGIAAAVTRRTLDGRHPDGWFPEQRLTVEETVRAYTVGSAFAEFQEHAKGTVTVGKLADLVLLDRDLFTIPAPEIESARVLATLMDGRVVHDAGILPWDGPAA